MVTLTGRIVPRNIISLLAVLCLSLVSDAAQNYMLTNGNLRLNGGRTPMEGRLEVYYMGYWGTICDDYWEWWIEGRVACGQMDYSTADLYDGPTNHLSNAVPILLDDVRCSGDEERITDCTHREWTLNDCFHIEDVYLKCRGHYDTIRLVGSEERHEGRVEVFREGTWGTVCDLYGHWDYAAADVVCRQLGYRRAVGVTSTIFYEVYSDEILSNFFYCRGDEYSLSECRFLNSTDGCSHGLDVAVICDATDDSDTNYPTWSVVELTLVCTFVACTSFLIVVVVMIRINKMKRRRRRRRRRRELAFISGSGGFENPNYLYATPDLSAYHPTGYPAMPPSYSESQTEVPPSEEAQSPPSDGSAPTISQRRQNAIYEDVATIRYLGETQPTLPSNITSSYERDDKDDDDDDDPGEMDGDRLLDSEQSDLPPPYTPLQNSG